MSSGTLTAADVGRGARWFLRSGTTPDTAVRLFCFPYAGGNAGVYRNWPQRLARSIELCAVQPPGRASRVLEQPYRRFGPLIEDLAEAMLPLLDKPAAFFGHSLGALAAFQLSRYLRDHGHAGPIRLFVSGCRAPHLLRPNRTYDLPEDGFLQELRRLNGTSMEALEDGELMQLLIPLIRTDFELFETYEFTPAAPLACGITAFGGLNDAEALPEDIHAWREHSSVGCSLRMLPGDHFFIHKEGGTLAETISRELLLNRASEGGR